MIRFLKGKLLHLAMFFAFWYLISLSTSPIVFPGPVEVLKALKSIILSGLFFKEVGITFFRGVTGIVFSFLLGSTLGVVMGISGRVSAVVKPYLLFLQATPVISWLMLALLWFDTGIVPFFVIVFSIFPIITLTIQEGVLRVDEKLLEMAKIYEVGLKNVLIGIYLPSITGYILSSLRIVVGVAFKIAVMAEVLAHPGNGIGEKMSWARINIETPEIVAWTIIIIGITYLADKFLFFLLKGRGGERLSEVTEQV